MEMVSNYLQGWRCLFMWGHSLPVGLCTLQKSKSSTSLSEKKKVICKGDKKAFRTIPSRAFEGKAVLAEHPGSSVTAAPRGWVTPVGNPTLGVWPNAASSVQFQKQEGELQLQITGMQCRLGMQCC